MFGSIWTRWSGLAGMLGGAGFLLALLGSFFTSDNTYPYTYDAADLLVSAVGLAAILLMIGGVIGLQARRMGGGGVPAGIAFAGAFAGLIMLFLGLGGLLGEMAGWFQVNGAWDLSMIGLITLFLGTVGFAVAGWRSGMLPRWSALLVIAGGLGTALMLLLSVGGYDLMIEAQRNLLGLFALGGFVVFMAGWVAIHYRLWVTSSGVRPVETPRPNPVAG
jgi:hypothetical protein